MPPRPKGVARKRSRSSEETEHKAGRSLPMFAGEPPLGRRCSYFGAQPVDVQQAMVDMLFEHVTQGSAADIARLLEQGVPVDARRQLDNDDTPLIRAVAYRAPLAIVDCLVAAGADPNARRRDGTAALHLAATRGGGYIPRLIEAGADVDARDRWRCTPVARAVSPAILACLAAAGGDVNPVMGGTGYFACRTPLYHAASAGDAGRPNTLWLLAHSARTAEDSLCV